MRLTKLYPIIVLLSITCLQAQDVHLDSLRKSIKAGSNYEKIIAAYILLTDKLSTAKTDEAISLCYVAIKMAARQKDSISIAQLQSNQGRAWYFKGSYDSAAKLYFSAIQLLERFNEPKKLGYAYNDIAKLYRKTKDLKRAHEKYEQAFHLFEKIKDSTGISTILNEWGVVFEYEENYAEAIKKYQASLSICNARNDQIGISYALSNIAGVYTIQKKYNEAEKNLLQALTIREQLKDSFSLSLTYADLGAVYKNQGAFDKANASYYASNAIASVIHFPELQSSNYNELSDLSKKQGNFEQAYNYQQQHLAIKDSIFKLESSQQIEELSTRYETEKKEQQIKIQQFDIERKNIFLWLAVVLIATVILISYLLYNRYRLKQQARLQYEILQQQELSTKAVIAAEENERKRIAGDLHDGVGQMMSAAKMNLSAIEDEIPFSSNSQRQAYEKVMALVDESCKEVRNVSHNMMPNALLKSGLASAVREFIDKIDSRVIKVDLYTEGLHEHIDSNVEIVLYRVIQECVNNVIKHSGGDHLDISLIKDADGISATIEDNGKGFDTRDRSKFDGIGLKNIQARIEFLKGTVDFNSSANNGTLVAIHVPMS